METIKLTLENIVLINLPIKQRKILIHLLKYKAPYIGKGGK